MIAIKQLADIKAGLLRSRAERTSDLDLGVLLFLLPLGCFYFHPFIFLLHFGLLLVIFFCSK